MASTKQTKRSLSDFDDKIFQVDIVVIDPYDEIYYLSKNLSTMVVKLGVGKRT